MSPQSTGRGGSPMGPTPQLAEIGGFLGLTFGFAWLLWGYWVVAMPAGGLVISPLFVGCAIVGGLAPSLAGIVITALRSGPAAVLPLLATIARPVARRDAIFALVAVPAITALSVAVQHLAGLQPRWPDPSLLAMALVWPVMAALGEEFGWRAFLLPRLIPHLGLIPSAIAIGLVWGVWHLPADYIGLKGYGDLFWLAFLINGPLILTAHSVIMTWLWHRTQASTLVAILYHWSVTATAIVAPSVSGEGWEGLASAAVGVALICLVAATLLVAPFGLRPKPGAV